MLDPFQLPFVQRALVEVLILAVPAGLLGTWIVLRGLAFFSHAVGTAAFPGLVLADGLGFAAALGAFGAAIVFAAGAAALARRRGSSYDSLTAMVLVGCLAAGVILASDVFRSGSNVETLLFGSLLLIDRSDIVLAVVVTLPVVLATALVGRRWLAAGFDPVAAGSIGAGSGLFDLALLGLIALVAVAALSVVGALLVSALLVVPAATVRLWTTRMGAWQTRQRRAGRDRGDGRPLALGEDQRSSGSDDRDGLRRGIRAGGVGQIGAAAGTTRRTCDGRACRGPARRRLRQHRVRKRRRV